MKKKVANIVFNSFENDSRVLKVTQSLANNGYEVEVIAHLTANLPSHEIKQLFKIKRFGYLDRERTSSTLGKLKAYLTFTYKSIQYTKKFEYLHCNDLNTLPIGFLVKRFYNKNIKIIYDAHEYETETIALSGLRKKISKYLERKLIKYADAVITVSHSIAEEYVRLYQIEKPYLILNTPPYQKVKKQDLFRETLHIGKDKNIFLYQGGLNNGRGIEILLDTFASLEDKQNVIVFMGYGELKTSIQQYALKHDNIYLHPAVRPEVLLNYTSSADYGISLIEDSCLNYRYCLPNKMFEYAMANLAIIVSNLPEMRSIVETYNIGVIMENNTKQGLEDAIVKISSLNKMDLQQNIKKAQCVFNWQEQEKTLLHIYDIV